MKSSSTLRRRVLTLAVAAGCGLMCGGAFAAVGHTAPQGRFMRTASPVHVGAPVRVAPVQHANATQFVTVAGATLLGAGDHVTGVAASTRNFPITVSLKLRNEAQLKAFNAKPHAPMSAQQFAAQYGPTTAQVQQVKNYLLRNGFRHITVTRDNLLVRAVGSSMAVKQAFQANMVNVRTADGRMAFANNTAVRIPANLGTNVTAVLGLQNVHVYHTQHTKITPLAVPTEGTGHYTPEFASIYNAAGLPPATDINVAVWGWGTMASTVSDLGDWLTANPTFKIGTTNTPTVVCTDVGATEDETTGTLTGGETTTGDATCGGQTVDESVEWDMDSQTILGMTGGVKSLTFYSAYASAEDGGPTDQALVDTLNEIVTPTVGEPLAQVINGSFGGCEIFSGNAAPGDGSGPAMDIQFQKGIAQDQTFSISEGDSGYNECSNPAYASYLPAGFNPNEAASSPADSPYVVGVSGTTLRTTVPAAGAMPAWARENVWFGSGGAPSSLYAAPAYQTALTYGQFAGQRGPDVAMDANPGTGAVYYNDGGLIQVGGTSLAAPLFTGAWARILEADKGNTTNLGFAGPHLYALTPAAFHDVTAGNNRGAMPVGGYIARPGWDWATGLGSLNVGVAAAQLAN